MKNASREIGRTRSGSMDNYTDDTKSSKRKRRGSWLIPIFIGVIVGLVIMFNIYPLLTTEDGVLKDSSEEANKSTTDNHIVDERVQLDVSTQITDIVKEVSPTVVGVTNIQTQADFWSGDESDEAGTGSGVIYKKDKEFAYVVTNNHVVENADMVEVLLHDDTNIEAEILGTDLFTDLAVLRVSGEEIAKVIELGTSDKLKVGEPAIAIGNPLGHMFAGSVTQGIISGKQRAIPQDFNQDGRPDWQAEVIQTDAAINPGNSGGALINIEGQLIGINSMKINQQIAQGIGFAIPIDSAKPIIEELEETGKVNRPYMGVELYSLEEVPQVEWRNTLRLPEEVEGGVYIWSVETLSPADKAGIERLDVITSFAGEEVNDILELRKILYQEKQVGDEVEVIFYRNGEKMEVTLTLEEQK